MKFPTKGRRKLQITMPGGKSEILFTNRDMIDALLAGFVCGATIAICLFALALWIAR